MFARITLQSCWPFIAGIAVLGLLKESLSVLERRYTKRLILTDAVTDVLTVLLAGLWLLRDNLMNPPFLLRMEQLFSGDELVGWMSQHIPLLLFLLIAFACIVDLITTLWKLKDISD